MGAHLDTAYSVYCASNEDFGPVEVQSDTKPNKKYGVWWGPTLKTRESQYGPHCSCRSFKFRESCKHTAVLKSKEDGGIRCAWNACLEPTLKCNYSEDGKPSCPECGGSVRFCKVGI